jgi:2-iminobutanoate/2-iminopropanoate deaminase
MESATDKTVITTEGAPAPFRGAPYSQAIVAGGFVFTSGQLGLNPETGQMEEGITAQTERLFSNLVAVLSEAGSSLDKLVKATAYLVDFSEWEAMNDVYRRHAGDKPPARSAIEVKSLPAGARVEIDFIACL